MPSVDESMLVPRYILDKLRQGLSMFDGEQRLLLFNLRYAEMYDLDPSTLQVGMTLRDIVALRSAAGSEPDMNVEQYAMWRDHVAAGSNVNETVVRLRNGRTIEIHHEPTGNGGWVSTHDDITARLIAEEALRKKTAMLDATLHNMDQGLVMVDALGAVQVCNDRAVALLNSQSSLMSALALQGAPTLLASTGTHLREEEVASASAKLAPPESDDVARSRAPAHGSDESIPSFNSLSPATVETITPAAAHLEEHQCPNGKVLEIRTVLMEDGGTIRTYTDVTARKRIEKRIAHLASHDALTGLPNRVLFWERLNERLFQNDRKDDTCALLCLDLDDFKNVNDTFGHVAGDAVLREISRRLQQSLTPEDMVARLGGDEFAILLAGGERQDSTLELCKRLIEVVAMPVIFDGLRATVGASIGVAYASQHGAKGDALFGAADLALYQAKSDGKNNVRVFSPEMNEAVAERSARIADLRRAISEGDLVLHYQPQVQPLTGKVLGFEALVRWQHVQRGLIPPSDFIPLAEESGLIVPLGEWVLRAACRAASYWSSDIKVAVNLSPLQFQQANLPELVLEMLTETGLSPSRLEVEITENVIISDLPRALAVLRSLKAIGVRIAMDDFGTGYSSLTTLQAFPFDKIKIDRSFIGSIGTNPQASVIVSSVLNLGRELGMDVVAEGIETAEQLRFLVEERCTEVQGYLLGRPEPLERLRTVRPVLSFDQLSEIDVGATELEFAGTLLAEQSRKM